VARDRTIIANPVPEEQPLSCSVLIRSRSANSACVAQKEKPLGGSAVEYKQFFVKAFEQRPGKWHARVKRLDGKPILVARRDQARVDEFVTSADSPTPDDALLRAITAIDAGAFSRRGEPSAN